MISFKIMITFILAYAIKCYACEEKDNTCKKADLDEKKKIDCDSATRPEKGPCKDKFDACYTSAARK